jgi:hypothetical protein
MGSAVARSSFYLDAFHPDICFFGGCRRGRKRRAAHMKAAGRWAARKRHQVPAATIRPFIAEHDHV